MIVVEDVYKRYQTVRGPGRWVLRGVNLTIPTKVSIGIIGRNGAGKSTLLRMIGGIDYPTRGRIERRCRVSYLMGRAVGLPRTLTGRQNARFVCRIYGHDSDVPERLAQIQDFAELGEAFDEPIGTYSSGMRSRLQFAISLAFDFDVYLADEGLGAGDAGFRNRAKEALRNRVGHASIVLASHQEHALRQFCTAGVFLRDGQAHWYDDIDDALRAYEDSLPR